MRSVSVIRIAAAFVIGIAGTVLIAQPAQAAPSFQLPFPCGQTWRGNNSNSGAHVSWEIDFNRGSSDYADLGDTVVAAAAGKVVTAKHQGEVNGYGNLIVIDHGGGYYTYYAHLRSKSGLVVGENVLRGQAIGSVGNTTKSTRSITPHLHYEVRYPNRSQSNIIKAKFNGSTFNYASGTHNITSNNCATPYDPVGVCGSSYYVIDSRKLGTYGTANLLWNGSKNCVTTLKMRNVGTATYVNAFITPKGSYESQDPGNWKYYAGPVRRTAPGCVSWGGSTGGYVYNSPNEHCG